jgi:hypothetical protein
MQSAESGRCLIDGVPVLSVDIPAGIREDSRSSTVDLQTLPCTHIHDLLPFQPPVLIIVVCARRHMYRIPARYRH